MILRDYQLKIRAAVREQFKECNSTLVVAPTGTGKTIIFADMIKCYFPRRSLIVAHRQELIFQARDKIKAATGLQVEVEMGNLKTNHAKGLFGARATATVCSIQTLTAGGDGGGRMGKFDPNDYALLIIDEAHHATASSYKEIIRYFGQNDKLKILGVTATPDRADEEALGQIFDTVAYDYEILDAINDGWLVPIDQQMVEVKDLDFSHVRTTAGDLNGADLAAIMEQEQNLHGIVGPCIDLIGDKRTLVFTSSVKHAEMLCALFNRYKPHSANWVCGRTPSDRRAIINQEFHDGKLQILCNCGTHTEGFDSPGVEVVVMARPTKSRALYAQMVGRSTRPLPGVVDGPETAEARREAIYKSKKSSCLVIDFVGNSGKHKLVTSVDILGGNISEEIVKVANDFVRKNTGQRIPVDELLEEAKRQAQEREEKRLADEARKAKLMARVDYKRSTVDPFSVLHIKPTEERGWDKGKELSEKQRNFLRQQGINPDGLEHAKAKQLIDELFNRIENKLCTFKQANVLKRFGYPTDMTKEAATKTLDALAKNGWKRPPSSPTPIKMTSVAEQVEAIDENVPF